MKLLLDTHAFIWWDSAPEKLSSKVLTECRNPENLLMVSAASIWEMQIKHKLGKLVMGVPLEELVATQKRNGLVFLPVDVPHVLEVSHLPDEHKDPFDRVIAAQSIVEGATLVTVDAAFKKYPVSILW